MFILIRNVNMYLDGHGYSNYFFGYNLNTGEDILLGCQDSFFENNFIKKHIKKYTPYPSTLNKERVEREFNKLKKGGINMILDTSRGIIILLKQIWRSFNIFEDRPSGSLQELEFEINDNLIIKTTNYFYIKGWKK